MLVLAVSFTRMGLDQGVVNTPGALEKGVDFTRQAWPIRIEIAPWVEHLVQLGEMQDPNARPPDPGDGEARWRRDSMIDTGHLPMFSYIENRPVNPRLADTPVESYPVERFGYVKNVYGL